MGHLNPFGQTAAVEDRHPHPEHCRREAAVGRLFADFAATLDYSFAPAWTFETNYHRYENWGELDSEPTEKEESEFAVIRQLPHNRTLGLSFFHHIQHDGANDQFSQVKLKYGIGF